VDNFSGFEKDRSEAYRQEEIISQGIFDGALSLWIMRMFLSGLWILFLFVLFLLFLPIFIPLWILSYKKRKKEDDLPWDPDDPDLTLKQKIDNEQFSRNRRQKREKQFQDFQNLFRKN
jgi:hypothetical protein